MLKGTLGALNLLLQLLYVLDTEHGSVWEHVSGFSSNCTLLASLRDRIEAAKAVRQDSA